MPFLQAQQVRFTYDPNDVDAKEVLHGVDLSIEEGQFVALLGHNGCGKSTMAKLFNGMLLPTAGKILVDGMDTADESQQFAVRSRVGLVQQNPDNQLVAGIVEEDVAFGPENLGVPPAEIRRRVDAALKAVDMYEYREHAPHKLSGGQKQRVAIAGVIAMETKCIVLDEPTAMLDPRGRREVMDTIQYLNREKGITIVLITHYMDEAVQAGRVVVMDEGNILVDGAPDQVFGDVELLKRHDLDVPQATELCYRLRAAGIPLPGCPGGAGVRGHVPALSAGRGLRKGRPALNILETKDLCYQYGVGTPFQKPRWRTCPWPSARGSFWGSSATRAAGSPPSSKCSTASSGPPPARCCSTARTSGPSPKRSARCGSRWAWCSSTRSTSSSRRPC